MKIDDVLESQAGPARMFLIALLFFWNGELLLSSVRGSRLSMALVVLSLLLQGSLHWIGRRWGSRRRGALLASAGTVLGLGWFGSYSIGASSPDTAAAVLCIFVATLTFGLLWMLAGGTRERAMPTGIPSHALAREVLWALGTAIAMMFVVGAIPLTTAAILFVTGMPGEVLSSDSLPLHLRLAIAVSNYFVRLAPFPVFLALFQRCGRFLHRRFRTPFGTALSNTEAALGAALVPLASAIANLFFGERAGATDAAGPLAFLFAVAALMWLGHFLARSVAFGGGTDEGSESPFKDKITMKPTSLNRLAGELEGRQVTFWASRWSGVQTLAIDGKEVSQQRSFRLTTTHDLPANELGITRAITRISGGRILDLYRGFEKVATLTNPREAALQARAGVGLGLVSVLSIELLKGNTPPIIPIEATSIQVISIQTEGSTWRAEVKPGDRGKAHTLRRGDRLKDGVVRSVSKDHMMVEWAAPRNAFSGEPGFKALLRFSPPQPLPPITLGRETTWITSPLLRDGTPDYGAWLNEKYGTSVTPENNAAEPLREALAGLVDSGQTFWDGISSDGASWPKRLMQPWSDKDCPKCVARLKLNERPLAAAAEAARRPRYFVPFLPAQPRISQTVMSPLLPFRTAANALAARGMLRVGSGDVGGAGADALATLRLAVALDQGLTLIERLIAFAVRGVAAPLLPATASAPSLSAPQARSLLLQLARLPPTPNLAEGLEFSERAYWLDTILVRRSRSAERGAGGMALEDPGNDFGLDPVVKTRYALSAESFDWEAALRDTNQDMDLTVALWRASTTSERQVTRAAFEAAVERRQGELASLTKDLRIGVRSQETELADMAVAAEQIAQTAEGRKRLAVMLLGDIGGMLRVQIAANESETESRLGVVSVALAAHRLSAGAFPETLAGLDASLLPWPLVPSTALSGYTLEYTLARAATGGAGSFAITAIPEEQGATGLRAFCVDSTGALRFTLDGAAPKIVSGVCDATLERAR
jgi:hypothetical protein